MNGVVEQPGAEVDVVSVGNDVDDTVADEEVYLDDEGVVDASEDDAGYDEEA